MTDAGLTGKVVRLRALRATDLERLRGFINDPEVLRMSNVYRPISDAQQDAWWKHVAADPTAAWFAIDDVATDVLVGTCCLVDLDWVARVAELRVRIGDPGAWGRGLGSEACVLLVEYAFLHLGLERVWLRVFAQHARAQRLYEKLGFVVEGRLRRHWQLQGVRDDVIVMGLLHDEWRRRS